MEQLTPEQRKAINKIGVKFSLKSAFIGMECAALAMLANLVLVMGVQIWLDGDKDVATVGSIIIGVLIFRRMFLAVNANFKTMHEEVRKIVKKS